MRRRTPAAAGRFALYLAREFRWPLGVFLALVLGGGLLVHLTYTRERLDFAAACHGMFLLIFMQPQLPFPDEWYLRVLFFAMPLIGLGAVADSVVRLAYLIFSRKQQLQEWQIMNASTMRNHLVVIGVGKIGYRILLGLEPMGIEAVGVDLKIDTPLAAEILDRGIPVIQGDARNRKVLEKANVAGARGVIAATDDDLANIDAALTAREIRPDLHVVLRLFDDTLASKLAGAFRMPAISSSNAAAPAFLAAITGRSVYHCFRFGGREMRVTDMAIEAGSEWAGRTVGEFARRQGIQAVALERADRVEAPPPADWVLRVGDKVVIIAPQDRLAGVALGGGIR